MKLSTALVNLGSGTLGSSLYGAKVIDILQNAGVDSVTLESTGDDCLQSVYGIDDRRVRHLLLNSELETPRTSEKYQITVVVATLVFGIAGMVIALSVNTENAEINPAFIDVMKIMVTQLMSVLGSMAGS